MEDKRGAEGNSFAGRLNDRLVDVEIKRDGAVRELVQLTEAALH
jgi:hypothetical protein